MTIQIKRIYEPAQKTDGYRVLVDRLWPRGVSRQKAALDEWLKEIAPSTELREWFDHKPERFAEFKKRYQAELADNPALQRLRGLAAKHGTLTLLYAARDPDNNHAKVLVGYLS
ncbi:MAG TPA: DUF488 domain-containing protein [Candidatus Saccharimonas sp.]|nr:DUF488 domain-containing protein [Candidatus Saccharimonas sp.]